MSYRRTARHIASAVENLKKAAEVNAAKPHGVDLICPGCGTKFNVRPSHSSLRRYCCKECMSKGYADRMRGSGNPNYRNAFAGMVCQGCGDQFGTYAKGRKYCSHACYTNYAPRFKHTGGGHSYLDNNQAEIVTALRDIGTTVFITSAVGGGCPDLICGFNGIIFVLEIKNPKTPYGRKGLTASQRKFWDKWSAPGAIVHSIDEALTAARRFGTDGKGEPLFGYVDVVHNADEALALAATL